MERKLRRESASVYTLCPHIEYKTSFELTKLESNRDEREWNATILPAATFERHVWASLRKCQRKASRSNRDVCD